MSQLFVSFFSGLIFALGLGISGMTQPSRVTGFLDLFGAWEPALAFVMLGAIVVYAIGYRLILKRKAPLLAGHFHIPTLRSIDKSLAIGSLIFGFGWGMVGYCPGPALTAVVTLQKEPVIFFIAMIAAMNSYALLQKRKTKNG